MLKHVGFIMDGNRRWAKEKGFSAIQGHRAGYKAIKEIIKYAVNTPIDNFTIYAFSTENWSRPKSEVKLLMSLFEEVLNNEIVELIDEGIKLRHIGRRDRLNDTLISLVDNAVLRSAENKKLTLNLALDYGGRDEILRAINGLNNKNVISEDDIKNNLDLTSDPDLIIRTGGEHRISNFLLWQAAYSEFLFLDKFLPDFSVNDFKNSIQEFNDRKRRFGE